MTRAGLEATSKEGGGIATEWLSGSLGAWIDAAIVHHRRLAAIRDAGSVLARLVYFATLGPHRRWLLLN